LNDPAATAVSTMSFEGACALTEVPTENVATSAITAPAHSAFVINVIGVAPCSRRPEKPERTVQE
jgi:hypothetical protein